MPTDQSPALRLLPVSAVENMPSNSPVKAQHVPETNLVSEGHQEIEPLEENSEERALARLCLGLESFKDRREDFDT